MGWTLYLLISLLFCPGDLALNSTNEPSGANNSLLGSKQPSDDVMITASQLQTSRLVMDIVMKPIVCISGFVMNVIGIWVLLDKSLSHSSYRYLLGLLVADVGFLLCGIVHYPSDVVRLSDPVQSLNINAIIDPPIRFFLEHIFAKVSLIIICILSLERLLAISRPLKIKDMILARHAGKINVAVYVIIFLLYIPRLFDAHFVPIYDDSLNRSTYRLEIQNHTESVRSFINLYRLIIIDTVLLYGPMICLFSFNVAIWIQMCRIRKRRKTMFGTASASAEQSKITFTLLVISGFFLANFIPMLTSTILLNLHPELYERRMKEINVMLLIKGFTQLLRSVNAANDFIIFLATNVKFRLVLKRKFQCRVNKRQGSSESTQKTSKSELKTSESTSKTSESTTNTSVSTSSTFDSLTIRM